MVYREDAYREVFPEQPVVKVTPQPAQSMIEDETEVVKPDETEKELEVEAPVPDPVQEGGTDDSGSSDTAD